MKKTTILKYYKKSALALVFMTTGAFLIFNILLAIKDKESRVETLSREYLQISRETLKNRIHHVRSTIRERRASGYRRYEALLQDTPLTPCGDTPLQEFTLPQKGSCPDSIAAKRPRIADASARGIVYVYEQDLSLPSCMYRLQPLDSGRVRVRFVDLSPLEKEIQQEVLRHITTARFGEDNSEYIFAGTWDFISLSGPYQNKDIRTIDSARGLAAMKQLILIAKQGGGFTRYTMPFTDTTDTTFIKISYVKPIPEWKWYIGSGITITDIRKKTARIENEMNRTIIQNLLFSLLLLLGIIYVIYTINSRFARKISNDVKHIITSLNTLLNDGIKINTEPILLKDFTIIAQKANTFLDKKNALENELLLKDRRFRSIINTAPLGILLVTLDEEADTLGKTLQNSRITLFNPAFSKMLGFAHSTLIRKSITTITHPEDMEQEKSIFRHLTAPDFTYETVEKRFISIDGNTLWTNTTYTLLEEDRREILILVEDITRQKALQEQLKHTEKMETIGQLAGGVAHDFNNQIGGIMGFAELIQAEADTNSPVKEYADSIIKAANSSAKLTSQLLAFARKGKYNMQIQRINEIVNDVTRLLKHTLNRNIRINLDLHSPSPAIKGDGTQLENSILNLAINAKDAMPRGGDLTISTGERRLSAADIHMAVIKDITPGPYAFISVADTGTGILKKDLSSIFDPFFTTKAVGKGTGMGLAAVFGTVKNHDGTITVQGTPQKGTAITIYIPQSAKDAAPVRRKKNIHRISHSARIALIDDEDIMRTMGRKILEKCGYHVEVFASGSDFFAEYSTNIPFDLIILDMIMPGLSGGETFDEIRSVKPDQGVIIVSGYEQDGDINRILEESQTAFMAKPYTTEELSENIRKLLEK
ncbi:MAG: cache domain-containing protein [Fibrobacterota bacterium]